MNPDPTGLVLADSGFWLALYDARDAHHAAALRIWEGLNFATFLFPWPIYYEVLRTRFVRRPQRVLELRKLQRSRRLRPLDDVPYRDEALAVVFGPDDPEAERGDRHLSLVDVALRLVLADLSVRPKIARFITFNPGDFSDICNKYGVELCSDMPA